jgi:hypothetical protein
LLPAFFQTAVPHTPAPTANAELLNLSLGTYRYRLTKAVERIAEWLWQRALHDLG